MDRHLIKNSLKALTFGTALMVLGTAASAADLNPAPVIDGDTVRLGDVFSDAGTAASVIIANAPAPGQKLYFSAYELENIAKQNGIDWVRPKQTTRIPITRSGKVVTENDIRDLVLSAVTDYKGNDQFSLSLYGTGRDILIPSFMSMADIDMESVSIDDRTGRFSVWLQVPISDHTKERKEVRGKIEDLASVPVLRSALVSGEVISEDDVYYIDIPARLVTNSMITQSDMLIGKSPKRTVRSGKPLRMNDVQNPITISKGSAVKMIVKIGNLSVTSTARALEDGGEGDMIKVMSTANKKTLMAIVINPTLVEIPAGGRLASTGFNGGND